MTDLTAPKTDEEAFKSFIKCSPGGLATISEQDAFLAGWSALEAHAAEVAAELQQMTTYRDNAVRCAEQLAARATRAEGERDKSRDEVASLAEDYQHVAELASKRLDGMVALQQHRDAWRNFAKGKVPEPSSYLNKELLVAAESELAALKRDAKTVGSPGVIHSVSDNMPIPPGYEIKKEA